MTPLVGLTTCAKLLAGEKRHDTPARYAEALLEGAGVMPVMLPPLGEAMLGVLDRLDGLLLTGSPSNVMPNHYGVTADETPDEHDTDRDATTLPLIRAAIARGIPLLAICRGIQELNVALGGTLYQRVHLLDGREDHRGLADDPVVRYAPRHRVALSGELARIIGAASIMVNTSHGQAIDQPAPGLIVEARADDGTIEAVRVADATAFAIGVQWHPEWRHATAEGSAQLFTAFGDACRARAVRYRAAA
jgi:putative glutamine amidotransferase